jgi:hypothetical protein
MGFQHHLLRAELAAVVCLVLYGLALVGAIQLGAAAMSSAPQTFEEAVRPFVLVLWFSILPTTALFAPSYALFHSKGWANMAAAIVLGIASSAVLVALFRNGAMALYALPSGAVVGAATHFVMKRWARRSVQPPVVTPG